MTPRASAAENRGRILAAAAAMLAENPAARLSVRAVAQRAGISTGSLRHVFPTQRDLIDGVVAEIAALQNAATPDEALLDTDQPAVDRLLDLLRRTLHDSLANDLALNQLRAALTHPEQVASDDDAAPTLALERLALHQMASWVSTLRTEATYDSTPDEAARFLSTVLTGLVTEHALPGGLGRRATHDRTLRLAATAVLAAQPSPRVGDR